jgi:hypothetical protein
LTSTGGFDWWSLHTSLPSDTVDMGTGVAMGSYSITVHAGVPPVLGEPAGAFVSLPPIHNHHATLSLYGAILDMAHSVFTAPCDGDVDVLACQATKYAANGFMSPFLNETDDHGSIYWLFNDIRPAGSPPVVWYLNYTATILDESAVLARKLRPVYQFGQVHAERAGTTYDTIPVPTDADSFMVWEGKFPLDGALVGPQGHITKLQAHDSIFQSAFIISATAEELGLNEARFFSPTGCDVVRTAHAGYASNAELLSYMRGCCPSCFETPRLMLNASSKVEVLDGVAYQREPIVRAAAAEMPVKRRQPYTQVALLGRSDVTKNVPSFDVTGPEYDIHVHWKTFFTADHPPGESGFERIGRIALAHGPIVGPERG